MLVDCLPCEARPRCVLLVFDGLEPRRFGWETCRRVGVSHKFGLCFWLIHVVDCFVGRWSVRKKFSRASIAEDCVGDIVVDVIVSVIAVDVFDEGDLPWVVVLHRHPRRNAPQEMTNEKNSWADLAETSLFFGEDTDFLGKSYYYSLPCSSRKP